jgi:PAT family beta-lactamase induction signal transducer AmpG
VGLRPANLLDTPNGRFTAFGLLYISEGIPYGFTSVAMVTFMRQQGLSLEQIGIFVAALYLPWALKWAWAPAVDIIKLTRWGGRKAWILICSSLMIATLVVTAVIDFAAHFELLLAMIVLNNLFGATQDVAIDSLAVSSLQADERGRGNGFMFAGQSLGIALGGGGAIFISGLAGFSAALVYVSVLLVLNLFFVVSFIEDRATDTPSDRGLFRTLKIFIGDLYAAFLKSGRGPRVGLLFSILPIAAMALAYAMLNTIKVDYGLSDNEIAELSIYNTSLAALGCVIGGFFGDRFGIKRSLAICIVLTALPTLLLANEITSAGLNQIEPTAFYLLIMTHGLFFGMCMGLHAGIFMGITNPLVAATQFTAFMAMGNLVVSYTNFWQGMIAERLGYATVLYLDTALIILPLIVLPFISVREEVETPLSAVVQRTA